MIKYEKYLKLGLIALSNSTKFGSWFNGHIGAEVLTNTFFLKEFEISTDLETAIINRIESILNLKSAFFESDLVSSSEISSIVEIEGNLEKNVSCLSTAGHGVIYGTLAIKAIKQLNGWLPYEVKIGIMQLQLDAQKDLPNRYFGYDDYQNQTIDISDIPKFETHHEASKYCLEHQNFFENQKINGVQYFFQGNQLHDITHSQALFMLDQLGYHKLSKIGLEQLRKQIKLGQAQPPTGKLFHSAVIYDPFVPSFWKRDVKDEHHYKLAYSIAFLSKHIENINREEILAKASTHWEIMD